MKKNHTRSLTPIDQWRIDVGFDHPIRTIRSYHVVSPKDCSRLIAAAEDYAINHGGWTKKRHKEAPTTDIPFDLLGGENRAMYQKWKEKWTKKVIRPLLFRDYNARFISYEDLFLVRYTVDTQSSLKIHRDGTIISFVLQLNDDFTGGGTYIQSIDKTLRHSTGDLCIHSGWFFHGAKPVISGARYVLIGFCNIQAHWHTQRKLQPNAPMESDGSVIRKGVRPEFRHKSP